MREMHRQPDDPARGNDDFARVDGCKKFWKLGQPRLDQWSADIRAGKAPDFTRNLNGWIQIRIRTVVCTSLTFHFRWRNKFGEPQSLPRAQTACGTSSSASDG